LKELFSKDVICNVKLGSRLSLDVWIPTDRIGIQFFKNAPHFNDLELLNQIYERLKSVGLVEFDLYAWYPSIYDDAIIIYCDNYDLAFKRFDCDYAGVKHFFNELFYRNADEKSIKSLQGTEYEGACAKCSVYELCNS
jgi:hypothetical protein